MAEVTEATDTATETAADCGATTAPAPSRADPEPASTTAQLRNLEARG